VRWSLEFLNGKVLAHGREQVRADPQAATQVCMLDFSDRITDENIRSLVFIADLWQGGQFIARQTAGFAPIKHLSMEDPAITAVIHSEKGKWIFDLSSRSLALLVELTLKDIDVIFSDNYFNLPPGRTIRISCPRPAGWTLSRARKSLKIRSVYDSYAHES
jgi:beta-mannosidase